MRKPIIALVAVIAAVFGILTSTGTLRDWYTQYILSSPPPAPLADANLRDSLVPFSLPDLTGKRRNIQDWRGKVIVLNFWATWCPPCREEIPMFLSLYEQYKQSGLEIVGVAIDRKELVEDYRDTLLMDYPILVGERDAMQIMKDYGNYAGVLPYSVVIDRQGGIRHRKLGAYTRKELEGLIRPLL